MHTLALVEDNLETSNSFMKVLTEAGYQIEQFFNRKTAESALKSKRFDALLLDLQLDGDDLAGIGVFTSLPPPPTRPPVLVISGLTDIAMFRPLTLELGVWDYLPKPVDNKSLLIKVDRLIKETRSAKSIAEQVGELGWDPNFPGTMQWRGNKLRLPNTAFRLLIRLVKAQGTVVSYKALFDLLDTGKTKENLRAHVKVIRDEFLAVDPTFDGIGTDPGHGYRWNAK